MPKREWKKYIYVYNIPGVGIKTDWLMANDFNTVDGELWWKRIESYDRVFNEKPEEVRNCKICKSPLRVEDDLVCGYNSLKK